MNIQRYKPRTRYRGLSTDDKPQNAEHGSTFHEMDTGTVYFFDRAGGEWHESPGDVKSEEKTVTGNPITVTDALSAKAKSLTVALEPMQDLHGQSAPYPAGGGKNLFNPDNLAQLYYNSAGTALTNTHWITSDYIAVTPGETYTLSVNQQFYALNFVEFDADKTWVKNSGSTNVNRITKALSDSTAFVRCGLNLDNTSDMDILTAVATYHPQAEKGSAATAYAPYSNICPIFGRTEVTVTRCGVNLWDEVWEQGGLDNNGNKVTGTNRIRSKNFISILPNTDYYIVIDGSGFTFYTRFYDQNGTYVGSLASISASGVRKSPAGAYKMLFYLWKSAWTDYANHPNISINSDASDTAYHAYEGQSLTIPLGQTVYGGNVNMTTGEMVVDRAMVDLGTLTWSASSSNPGVFSSTQLSNHALTTGINVICSHYPAVDAGNYSLATMPDKTVKTNATYADYIYIKDSAYTGTSAADFKTAMSGVQVCYYLSTPFTIQLTPQQLKLLKGTNNVWTDGNDITMTYKAKKGT